MVFIPVTPGVNGYTRFFEIYVTGSRKAYKVLYIYYWLDSLAKSVCPSFCPPVWTQTTTPTILTISIDIPKNFCNFARSHSHKPNNGYLLVEYLDYIILYCSF